MVWKELTNLEESVSLRLFQDTKKQITQIVRHAKDEDGFRKYENESHFVRCAVQRLIRAEHVELDIKRGRPKKVRR